MSTFLPVRYFVLAAGLLCLILACGQDDELLTDPTAKLTFSSDTLTFDTVFTTIGSATRILKMYNNFDQPMEISSISIAGGADTKFRLNIDGDAGNSVEDLIIPANDSLYIFGEVTVNPDEPLSSSPFVITDAIVFETNGNTQEVVLEAWGQNANYIPDQYSADSIFAFGCGNGQLVWDDPKPYVIYGIVFMDQCELILPAGTEIYVHGGLTRFEDQDGNLAFYNDGRLIIGPDANIKVEGTIDEPVTIQGDRLEESFEEISGQWFGLVLSANSVNNSFENFIIKNSLIGVVVDSAAELSMKNTQIFNTASNAVFARHAEVSGDNCLFYNNGSTALRLSYGGDYEFNYCTVGAFGNDQQSVSLNNINCLDAFCQEFTVNDLNADFTNCVFFGSNSDQISLSGAPQAEFNYLFDHCVLRVEDLLDPDTGYPDFFDNTENATNADRQDPVFADIENDDYRPDTLSIIEGQAMPLIGLSVDIEGNERDPATPDLGCFEYQYE